MTIAIIDYGAGNLRSATKAFELAVTRSGRPEEVRVTADPEFVAKADRVVLPGDGAFRDCRANLDAVSGMIEAIAAVIEAGRPFFGICVGMQLLASWGLEHGRTRGLDRIRGEVDLIRPADPALKVPHMGWNTLTAVNPHPLLDGLPLGPDGLHAFFLHAYALTASDPSDVVATADYGGPVTAIVARGNVAGTQFHPEKSQKLGLALIANFLAWRP
ncbi:MAG: imidazole glycerol phosphate synthase subunit HisH [Bauldia sp.]|nr:imidazole glycerol phosphate synthase subunit HisH [Bauldia sp.]